MDRLDDLRREIDALQRARSEPIAIVGLGCRFPGGADSPAAFWQRLHDGIDLVTEVPPERWDADAYYDPDPDTPGKSYTRWGAFVQDPDLFDAQFFGISPREAMSMDPQQRILLEVAWEALEHAGIAPVGLAGSSTGVFIGISASDYSHLHGKFGDLTTVDVYFGTGTSLAIAAGRIAYTLGLNGPALSVDTACSSSLMSVHLACQSLRGGECDLALAGGSSLNLMPDGWVVTSRLRMMSADGRCKTFDASANGYVRGEGCGLVVLKRLTDARADGDRILGLILSSATNQDGRSNGLTAPNALAQEALLRTALAKAGVAPHEVSHLETHGTGTALGDPIEIGAIANVFAAGRSRANPLYVTSVKTNVGHLEATAGIAGLIKVVLGLEHGVIPPHLHLRTPNPLIPWESLPIVVPTTPTPWRVPDDARRVAGMSAFGFSGTNVHVVLAEAPAADPARAPVPEVDRPRHLLCLSAKSDAALRTLAARYERRLSEAAEASGIAPGLGDGSGRALADGDGARTDPVLADGSIATAALADICATANAGRSHFGHRWSATGATVEEMRSALAGWLAGGAPSGVHAGILPGGDAPEVAFLFTGQGAQFAGMARRLYDTQPTFRAALDRCADLVAPHLDRPLLDVLYPPPGGSAPDIDDTTYTQPALFAVEYALAELWRSWGVAPAVVLGHSVGELVAACVAGVFDLADGLALAAARGRLMGALPGGGKMAAVFAGESPVAAAIAPFADRVSIAACNGPANTVISGAGDAVDAIVAALAADGVKSQPLTVSHAFHSPLMDPMLAAFEATARSIRFQAPRIGIVSNVTGRMAGAEIATPDYWVRHVRAPVRFAQSIQALHADGIRAWVEIGPKPTLVGMGRRCLPDDAEGAWLPSLRPGKDDWASILDSLATLYVRGAAIDWAGFDRDYPRRRVELPTYAFQRQRYWFDLPRDPGARQPSIRPDAVHPLLGWRLRSPKLGDTVFEAHLSAGAPAFLNDHRHVLEDDALFPAAGYAELGLAAAAQVFGPGAHALADVTILAPLHLPDRGARVVQVSVANTDPGAVTFDIHSLDVDDDRWTLHATGGLVKGGAVAETAVSGAAIAQTAASDGTASIDLDAARARCGQAVDVDAFYERYAEVGVRYGPSFRALRRLWRQEGESVGEIALPERFAPEAEAYALHPALLDACLQLLGAARPSAGAEGSDVYVPVGLARYRVDRAGQARGWGSARIQGPPGAPLGEVFNADIDLYDDAGRPVAAIEGLRMKRVRPGAAPRDRRQTGEWLYDVAWQPQPIAAPAAAWPERGTWLVLADDRGVAAALADRLRSAGQDCVMVRPGAAFDQRAGDHAAQVDPLRPDDFRRLVRDALGDASSPLRGVVDLWPLDADDGSEDAPPGAAQPLVCAGALHVAQALAACAASGASTAPAPAARLWLVTRGAQPAGGGAVAAPAQAPLWGLGRTLMHEHPELRCACVDLDPAADAASCAARLHDALGAADDEDQAAFRGGVRHVPRLVRHRTPPTTGGPPRGPYILDIAERGVLDNLALAPLDRRPPGPGEVEVAVHATGLNFRDVLNALGMYPGDPGPLGGECTGVVAALGPGVDNLAVGDEVIALAAGSFASHVTVPATLAFRTPRNLGLNEAATIPINFLTAWYGLHELAGIVPGDRVLVHAAAGGVGLAAVQIARQAGAEVYGTAGSEEKRAFLRSQGVQHVMSSRTLDFADEVMRLTEGRGVTIVLNALAEEFIPRSLGVLADGGRFLEIGKRGVWTTEQVAALNPTLRYHLYDLATVMYGEPEKVDGMMRRLIASFEAGTLEPLPLRTFPIEDAAAAFRFMAQAKHIGKLVLTHAAVEATADGEAAVATGESGVAGADPGAVIRPDAAYLVTGGLGGLGLKVAGWLADRGARHVVLMGRREPSDAARAAIDALAERGVAVVVATGDVAIGADVDRVFDRIASTMPPLRGVIHAAGVLDDGLLGLQSWPRFETVMAPKVDGAWNLHARSRALPLDFFVLFSTGGAVMGSAGQSNYAAANAYLDALAHHRRGTGRTALSVNWGPWADVGMAAALDARDRERWRQQGIHLISPDEGVALLERLIAEDATQAAVLPIRWEAPGRPGAPARVPPMLRELVRPAPPAGRSADAVAATKPAIRSAIEAAAPGDRYTLLLAHLKGQIASVLALDPSQPLDPQQGLSDMGMDSLTAVELSNRLQRSLGHKLPSTLAFEYPTITALAEFLAVEAFALGAPGQPGPGSEPRNGHAAGVVGGIDDGIDGGIADGNDAVDPTGIAAAVANLTEAEAEASLLEELDRAGYA